MTLEPVRDVRVTDHLPLVSRRTVELILRWLVIFFGVVLNGMLVFGTSFLQTPPS